LNINGAFVGIIGVENISAKLHFSVYGDLSKAANGCTNCDVKILLSHDPSHWDKEVTKEFTDIDLTLSGHTHGMQFGIEIPGIVKFSPIQFVYKKWAGLYKEGNQYLYVNRGLGFLGYPGRVGILPEITLLELKSV
jgi:predicted MPP superfamily phosphohydrolase